MEPISSPSCAGRHYFTHCLLDNIYARYDLYANIGLKQIVFQTFSISFWILKQDTSVVEQLH